ncbi:PQQ-dependent sugar dehydrogenase [Pelagerythrobacter rhizovicinus]|uniref:PQQ-dependent sugar dehydrogenase n=1 Tax=Pelagerythrobacter rhizovicinus TaxID=2268576 RepID=A0A4Q2KRM4_9SPHN|nr:PQQ-dependent sugar dehydrogenase [Pelagerythrobacter rhizovicinus]RXZ65971.1 PQQ-dependent sugar dehydrogenase [Pelagerythrobacter rhizovicinus]
MTKSAILAAVISPCALFSASCSAEPAGDSPAPDAAATPVGEDVTVTPAEEFRAVSLGTFDEPWAAAFAPGTSVLFITEKAGTMKFVDTGTGRTGTVTGMPEVDYGGQGGLGDVAFLPSESSETLDRRTIYLTWAEAGEGDTRGAALGRGTLVCEQADACAVEGLSVIWRQQPKVTGRGHYSHRIAFSPDGQYLFLASGDRQKMEPAQDLSNNLGSVLRLTLDGEPAPGNPFAERGSPSDEIWSYGHRNILGLQFDAEGRLWDLEHGPAGGDELNLVVRGENYGWPVVSDGVHYGGDPIPDHSTRPEFHAPALSWDPVIAPGDFVFYSGKLWPEWKGQAIIGAMKPTAIVRVSIEGQKATEAGRYPFEKRVRDILEGPDGALWILEDREGGRLIKLTPR